MVLTRIQMITDMSERGIPISPYMEYWSYTELARYYTAHTP